MKVAIYSRKSVFTGKGESLENQIQMCRKYYLNNYSDGADFEIYEDEGYTGANIKRPEFQRLLYDIKNNKICTLICYRLDRISRNVADFSSILELMQSHNVNFISIKEQFDTTTPLGKAMIYIASVFAQLERDTIAERVRDNMLELSKTGRWLGGQLPLGFTSKKNIYLDEDSKEHSMYYLTPIESEINLIKQIFNEYAICNSINYVQKKLIKYNFRGKNGGEFSNMSLIDILRNPVYVKSNKKVKEYLTSKGILFFGLPNGCGIILYNKKHKGKKLNPKTEWIAAVGKHKGVISPSQWLKVQKCLDKSKEKSSSIRLGTSKHAILSGLLRCSICGSPMRVIYGRTRKDGTKLYYYSCILKCNSGKERCNNPNANGPILEQSIIKTIITYYNEDLLRKNLRMLLKKKKLINSDTDINKVKEQSNNIKSQINILIDQLSKTTNETTQNILLKKADSLSSELNKLNQTICDVNNASPTFNYNINSFKDIYKLIFPMEHSPIISAEFHEPLKTLLNNLIKKIVFDGITNTAHIYFL